jgi:hypothetical protein
MPTPEASPRPELTRPRRERARRLLQMTLGLCVGAALTEAAFFARDRGAFPHLNVYVADARLGVRLRPGAEERVAFNGNPLTHVRINDDGFRGGAPPAPAASEILVVGDSQVFGLGVEEDETFCAELGRRHPGRAVLDLGVPTYGPPEYNAVLDEALTRRFPRGKDDDAGGPTVIYVVNLANDLFEADRPNAARHVVWDGWAVRAETAPERVLALPGREALFRASHAVFAFRSLLHGGEGGVDHGLPSEGTYEDLLGAAATRKARGAGPAGELDALLAEEREAQRELETAAEKAYPDLMHTKEGRDYQRTHGNPEDIVVRSREHRSAESSRPYEVTVTHLIQGAKIRRRIERSLRKRAEREIEKQRAKAVLASFAEREAIEKKIADLAAAPAKAAEALSPMREPLTKAKAIAEAHGARLVVLALPLDVAVSPAEWAKYGVEPLDMSDVKLLADDLMTTASGLGLTAVDATASLAAAEPGAFLNADLHLTPKGHRAVADVLDAALGPDEDRALGAGRSRAAKARKGK